MVEINELIKATAASVIARGKDSSFRKVCIDSRVIKRGEVFISIKGPCFDGHDFMETAVSKGARCIIKEKRNNRPLGRILRSGVTVLEVDDTVVALGDIARFHRKKFNVPLIAVSGSNGKTTTKEMIAAVLGKKYNVLKNEANRNNHIGLPLTLLDLNENHDIIVLEMGTNHLGEIGYLARVCLPTIGVITNISPAHLGNFGTLRNVLKEKYSLIENLNTPCIAVMNADNAFLRRKVFENLQKPLHVGFGLNRQTDFFASGIKNSMKRIAFVVNGKYPVTLKMLGEHNVYNALAAFSVGRILGVSHQDITAGLSAFKPLRGRLTSVEFKGISFIDDSYNSNPASLFEALTVLKKFPAAGRKIFVMGDMLELGEHGEKFHYEAGTNIPGVCDIFVAIGKLSRMAVKAAREKGFDKNNIFTCKSSLEAKDLIFNKLSVEKDDVVLIKGSRKMGLETIARG